MDNVRKARATKARRRKSAKRMLKYYTLLQPREK